MQLITISELQANYLKYNKQYVYVEGYYDGKMLTDEGVVDGGLFVDQDYNFHNTLKKLLIKNNNGNYVGKLRLVGKVGVAMTPIKNIGQILKVEIVDAQGNCIKEIMLDIESIPKELRTQI